MSEVSRRLFLKSGSAVVVAAGAISALPGLPAVVGVMETQGPADVAPAEAALAEGESTVTMGEPLIAHVRDLATGEIGLFTGTREITVLDPKLAASLVRALH
jgi:lipoprotein-anchoring transpeptidase ErfK/SrfK